MLSGQHMFYLLIFLAIVLIIFGPGKLPDLGSGMGRAIREFRKASTDIRDTVTGSTVEHPQAQAPAPPAAAAPQPPAPTPAGTASGEQRPPA